MKKLISALIVIIMMLSLTTISMAAEVSVSLSTLKEPAMQGKEMKVIFTVNNFTREGTQKAIEAKIEYDNTKLEYKSVSWNNGWTGSLSEDGTGIVVNKSSEVKESEEIAELTFLIKEDAEKGKTEIQVSEIVTSADGDEVEATEAKTEIEIIEAGIEPPPATEKTLSSIEITTAPDKTVYEEGEKFDKTGMVVIAKYSDETSKEVTNYTYSPAGKLEEDDTKITISYTEDGVTKTAVQKIKITEREENPGGTTGEQKPSGDNTQSGQKIPDAGVEKIIIPVIVVAMVVVVSYIGYKKYRNI